MGSKSYYDKGVVCDGQYIGFYKEIVINDCEARLYNPDLEKVIRFNDYSPGIYNINFSCTEEISHEAEELLNSLQFESFEEESKPNHYYNNGIMAWDIIDEIWKYFHGLLDESEVFYLGNIFKYLFRLKTKGQFESDIDKIKVYCDRLKEHNERLS